MTDTPPDWVLIEAQAAEIERLREEVDDLMRELAYNGRYPND